MTELRRTPHGSNPLSVLMSALIMLAFSVAGAGASDQAQAPIPSSPPTVSPPPVESAKRDVGYIWVASRSGSMLRLRGAVPSEDDRKTILGMVKAHFPDLEIEDHLRVADGGPPKEQWLGAVSFGLKQLAHLKSGSARLLNVALKVDGEARSTADYAALQEAFAGPLPTGISIVGNDVRPPMADPFIFTAELSSDSLVLSGSVPNERWHKQLREMARRMFERPTLEDHLEFASGAPKDWSHAVTASLRALSKLNSGKIAMSGLAVTIEGVAPDKGTATAISFQLKRDLPSLFSSSENISWKDADAAPAPALVVGRGAKQGQPSIGDLPAIGAAALDLPRTQDH